MNFCVIKDLVEIDEIKRIGELHHKSLWVRLLFLSTVELLFLLKSFDHKFRTTMELFCRLVLPSSSIPPPPTVKAFSLSNCFWREISRIHCLSNSFWHGVSAVAGAYDCECFVYWFVLCNNLGNLNNLVQFDLPFPGQYLIISAFHWTWQHSLRQISHVNASIYLEI